MSKLTGKITKTFHVISPELLRFFETLKFQPQVSNIQTALFLFFGRKFGHTICFLV